MTKHTNHTTPLGERMTIDPKMLKAKPRLDRLLNCNDPEGAYLLGRFEAQSELVDFMRTLARGLDLGVDVSEALAQLIKKHDAMMESVNQRTWTPGALDAKDRLDHDILDAEIVICGKVATVLLKRNTAELLGPEAAMDGDVGDLPDFDPDAQDNPYAKLEEG